MTEGMMYKEAIDAKELEIVSDISEHNRRVRKLG